VETKTKPAKKEKVDLKVIKAKDDIAKKTKKVQEEEEKKRPKNSKKQGPIAEYAGINPKKAASAYNLFTTPKMKAIKQENKELPQSEIMKMAAAEWGTLTDAEKKPFVKAAAADKVRCEAQMEDIKKKGFFMTDDGQKSCDLVPKEKKRRNSPSKKPEKRGKPDQRKSEKYMGKGKKKSAVSESDDSDIDVKDDSTPASD